MIAVNETMTYLRDVHDAHSSFDDGTAAVASAITKRQKYPPACGVNGGTDLITAIHQHHKGLTDALIATLGIQHAHCRCFMGVTP